MKNEVNFFPVYIFSGLKNPWVTRKEAVKVAEVYCCAGSIKCYNWKKAAYFLCTPA